jgi:hypothetical protein
MTSTLIPTISLTEFRKLKADELKNLKSCEITSDGEYFMTVIIPPTNGGMSITDTIRTEAEYLAMRGNTVGGKTLEELKSAEIDEIL